MKRETREHLKRYRGQWTWLSPSEVDDVLLSDARLRAQVRDLQARLKEARSLVSYLSNFTALSVAASVLDRATDLRDKNWRKP